MSYYKKDKNAHFYKSRNVLWFLVSIILILVCLGIYTYSKVLNTQKSYSKTVIPYATEQREKPSNTLLTAKKPLSFLLLGIDERANDTGRSDTMIVATIHPKAQRVTTVSIPRDAYVPIAGENRFDKINHAYAIGGVETSTKTVEELLHIPIDYVVALNMEGLQQLIAITGDITIDNPRPFQVGENQFKAGKIQITDQNVLDYVRMRKADKDGDFGRQDRQRRVMIGIVKKLKDPATIKDVDTLLTVMQHNMQTNIPLSDMNSLRKDYLSNIDKVNQLSLYKGQNVKRKGIYYYDLEKDNLEKIIGIFREELELQ